jgi:hypothetical protein
MLCIAIFGACSPRTRVRTTASNVAVAGSAATHEQAEAEGSTAYPYDLWIERAVYLVEQEADTARVRIEFVRWSNNHDGGPEALFRVINPGTRPVLVWNVRQQVFAPNSDAGGNSWQTRESDYPGRGWETATIPAGASVQFPMSSPSEGYWRVCLLYSRELPDSQSPNRRFGGDYESIGPGVQEVNPPD